MDSMREGGGDVVMHMGCGCLGISRAFGGDDGYGIHVQEIDRGAEAVYVAARAECLNTRSCIFDGTCMLP